MIEMSSFRLGRQTKVVPFMWRKTFPRSCIHRIDKVLPYLSIALCRKGTFTKWRASSG